MIHVIIVMMPLILFPAVWVWANDLVMCEDSKGLLSLPCILLRARTGSLVEMTPPSASLHVSADASTRGKLRIAGMALVCCMCEGEGGRTAHAIFLHGRGRQGRTADLLLFLFLLLLWLLWLLWWLWWLWLWLWLWLFLSIVGWISNFE